MTTQISGHVHAAKILANDPMIMPLAIPGSRPCHCPAGLGYRAAGGPSAAKWPVGPAPTMTARMPVPLFPPLPRRRNRRATATPASGQASAQPHRGESLTPDAAALHGGAAQRLGLGRDDLTGRVWPDHPSCTRSTAGHCETGCLPNVTGDHDPDRGGLHLISIWSPQHLHRPCIVLDLARHEGCHVVRATCPYGSAGGGRGCPILFFYLSSGDVSTVAASTHPFLPHSWDQPRRR